MYVERGYTSRVAVVSPRSSSGSLLESMVAVRPGEEVSRVELRLRESRLMPRLRPSIRSKLVRTARDGAGRIRGVAEREER